MFLVGMGIVGFSHAQFGVRAGLSSGNFSNTNYSGKLGFHVGAYYLLDFEKFQIEPGIQFAQKGHESTNSTTNNPYTETLNYIDMPLLARVEIHPNFNVFAGPQVSVLASRNYKEIDNNQTTTAPVKGYDIGGVLGFGVVLPEGFNFQVSYDLGLTNLNYFNFDVKNRVLKFSVGYDF